MSEELNKDIIPAEELEATDKVVEEATAAVEEEPKEKEEETPKQEEAVVDEEVKEDKPTEVLPEGESDDDKLPEKTEDDKPKEEATDADASDAVEEIPETVKEEVDVDAIKAELEELKAEKEERADVENLNKENARVAREYDELCGQVSSRLEAKLKELGIPLDKSITDLEAEDKAKAEIARKLIGDANELIERAKVAATDFLNKKAQDVIFKKADRLLRKYDVTEEEADVVANTFLDIIAQSGVRDLEDDLRAKVELAVAKAKMVCQHVAKTAEVVKEKADEVTEKIEKVEEIITPPKVEEPVKEVELKEESKVEEVRAEKEPAKPTLDTAEFEEGAVSKPQPTASITVDNVLDKMAALPYKEQTQFYKENIALIEEALRRGVK
jgi:hypothetical protein|nr:MAG TPA_asm: hypothetical protein [Caudoviricetes sp.]